MRKKILSVLDLLLTTTALALKVARKATTDVPAKSLTLKELINVDVLCDLLKLWAMTIFI